MLCTKEPNAEPIPGYRLIEPLGRGGFGQVWKCEAPGGLFKAIKFVQGGDGLGNDRAPAAEELEAIQHIKALRHPFLLSIERVETIDDELVIVMELADRSLQDLASAHRAEGRPGIPRAELLGFLREAAGVLDLMNLRHGLQHLDVKPGNLFVVSDHVKVADFGLVHSVADREDQAASSSLGAISPLYAAPELFRSAISPSSDQYSLAVVYQELLTGVLPFAGKNARQLAMLHTAGTPNLDPLPDADRPVVARALSKNPEDRFATCSDFILALLEAGAPRPGPSPETHSDLQISTGTASARPVQGKFLPDYQFAVCLGRDPATETWTAQTPDGRRWTVQFLYRVTGPNPGREREALARLRSLRHPTLLPVQLHPTGPGCLALVTDRVETTLRDRFQECRARGEKGLPRRQLLDWFRAAACCLDDMARQHGLAHLGLHPRNMLIAEDRLLIAEFGLISLVWQPAGQLEARVPARYAAPELLDHQGSPLCDQYSLAIIFQEMLTGVHPWRGRKTGPPNLDPLEPADRAVFVRALDPEADRRFANCTEMVEALTRAGGPTAAGGWTGQAETLRDTQVPAPRPVLAELMAEAARELPSAEPATWRPGPGGEVLQSRFPASLPPGGVRHKFDGFQKQWNARTLHEEESALVLEVDGPNRFWQRWLGKPPRLVLEIQWTRPLPPATGIPEVSIRIRASDKGSRPGAALLRDLGPQLLESLRTQLQGHPERRTQERLLWSHAVRATFVGPDGRRGETLECQGKDISLTGMGLYVPQVPPSSQVVLNLSAPGRGEPVELTGNFIRVQRCGNGWFEAGVLFER